MADREAQQMQLLSQLDGPVSLQGLNPRYRFYRYSVSDFLKPHTDWPVDMHHNCIDAEGNMVVNEDSSRFSLLTFLLFLNDDFDGGATRFFDRSTDTTDLVLHEDTGEWRRTTTSDVETGVGVHSSPGSALVFFNGMHPHSPLHASDAIMAGSKYVLRTEFLFSNASE